MPEDLPLPGAEPGLPTPSQLAAETEGLAHRRKKAGPAPDAALPAAADRPGDGAHDGHEHDPSGTTRKREAATGFDERDVPHNRTQAAAGPTVLDALGRYLLPLTVAVVCSWGFVWVAAIFAGIGAVVGAIAGFLATTSGSAAIPVFGTSLDLSSAMLGVLLGILGGALDGFMLAYAGSPLGMLDRLIGMALLGVVVTAILAWLLIFFEAEICRLLGYRRVSSRERERLRAALDLSGLGHEEGPALRIADSGMPFARTLGNSIVLSSGLLQLLPDEELAAILSHELMHHRSSDGLAWRMLLAAMLPLVALEWVRERAMRAGGTVGAMVSLALCPVLAVTHGLVLPVFARVSRAAEYQADAGVAAAGLGDPLVAALSRLAEFEDPGSGFGHALAATHPPVELRIDALLTGSP